MPPVYLINSRSSAWSASAASLRSQWGALYPSETTRGYLHLQQLMSWSYGVRKTQCCIQFLPVRLQNFLFLPLLHLKTVIPSQASFPWRGVWSSAGRLTVNPNATVRPPAGCWRHLYFHAGDHCFPSVMHGMHLHFEISALLCSLGPHGSGRWGFLLRGHRKSGGRKESHISTWVEGNSPTPAILNADHDQFICPFPAWPLPQPSSGAMLSTKKTLAQTSQIPRTCRIKVRSLNGITGSDQNEWGI